MESIIELNVGGRLFTTSLYTLTQREQDSMLAAMFRHHTACPSSAEVFPSPSSVQLESSPKAGADSRLDEPMSPTNLMSCCKIDKRGAYFIDRDGDLFAHILAYLRTGRLFLPSDEGHQHVIEALMLEADYFQLPGLYQECERLLRKSHEETRRPGVYLEVKDNIIYFRGYHVTTSLVGPIRQLAKMSPFKEEFSRHSNLSFTVQPHEDDTTPVAPTTSVTGSSARVTNTSLNTEQTSPAAQPPQAQSQQLPWCPILSPFYHAWCKGRIEEVYLNSDTSPSRLEWAAMLREHGWQLLHTNTCCLSLSEQSFVVMDKWFLPAPGSATKLYSSSAGSSNGSDNQGSTRPVVLIRPVPVVQEGLQDT